MRSLPLLLAGALGALACTPNIPQGQRPDQVVVLFDPSTSPPVLPTPNDLAIDQDTGFVAIPVDFNSSPAEQEFTRNYLNTLHGFPLSTPVHVGFSASLDPSTVTAANVFFADITVPTSPLLLTPNLSYADAVPSIALIPPPSGWERAHHYAVAIIGGDDGLRGKDGQPVVGSPVWSLIRMRQPLYVCDTPPDQNCHSTTELIPANAQEPAERLREQTENARLLEQLRRADAPLLLGLESLGVPRANVAMLWTFTISDRAEVTFDPGNGVVPLPNDVLLSTSGGRPHVALPLPDGGTPQQLALLNGLNTLDGFSTTAPIVSENSDALGALLGGRVKATSLTTIGAMGLVKLTNLTSGTTPAVQPCLNCASSLLPDGGIPDNPDQLQLVPQTPLDEKTTYFAFLTAAVQDTSDQPVAASPAFALVRSSQPLTDASGKSLVSLLTDAQARALEPLRLSLQPAFAALELQNIPRTQVVNAWTFTTQSTLSTLKNLVAEPATLPPVFDPTTPYLFDATSALIGATPGNPTDVGAIYQGRLTIPFALTGTAGTLNPAAPVPQSVPFLLVVPSSGHGSGPFPVVLFGHGLSQDRSHVLLVAGALAAAGYATFGIDFVWHGERTSCVGASQALSPGASDDDACVDPVNQRCDPTSGRCIARNPATRTSCVPLGNPPGDVVCAGGGLGRCVPDIANPGSSVCEGGAFATDATEIPILSGWNMLNLSNLFATRDNFRQPMLDLAQAARMIRASGPGSLDSFLPAGGKLDGTHLHYLGQSLGGIEGTLFTAAFPDIAHAALNVPGGNLAGLPGNPPRGVLLTSPGLALDKAALDATLAAESIFPGTPAYDQFVGFAKWIIDPADPVNAADGLLAPKAADPLSARAVFIQYITDDQIIPNNATEDLIAAANRRPTLQCTVKLFNPSQSDEPLGSRHAFLVNGWLGTPAQQALTIAAQAQVVTFLNTGTVP